MGKSGAYPRAMVVRGNAGGAGYSPLNAAVTRRTDRDRRAGDPRCGIRDGVSGHMARGCARAFRKTQPALSMRPETPPPAQLGPWRTGIDCPLMPRICKDE